MSLLLEVDILKRYSSSMGFLLYTIKSLFFLDIIAWLYREGGNSHIYNQSLTLSGPGFEKLAQTGEGGFRPPLNSAPLYPN